jgi:polar amino acid transport system substrate-binding protein
MSRFASRFLAPLLLSLPLVCAAAPIELMVEDAASPWSNSDGSGYANALVLAAFAAAHAEVKLAVVPYARCKTYVLAGAVAGCFSMSDAPELHGKVRFADAPLFLAYPRFFQSAAHPVTARSLAELAPGTRVAIVNGYEYPAEVMRLERRGIRLLAARSEAVNLKKLAAGRVDLALTMMDDIKTDDVVLREAQVEGVTFAFQAVPQGSFLGFSITHPDGERARALFNSGYAIIAGNGVKRAIDRKWNLPPAPAAGSPAKGH